VACGVVMGLLGSQNLSHKGSTKRTGRIVHRLYLASFLGPVFKFLANPRAAPHSYNYADSLSRLRLSHDGLWGLVGDQYN